MKKIIVILFLISFSLLAAVETVDRIIAKVGRDIVLMSELQRHIKQMEQMEVFTQDITEMDVLRDIIESKLVFQTAKERDYQVDENRIRQIVESQISNQIAQLGSESALRNELRRFDMTISDLRDYYDQMIREQRLKEAIINSEIKRRIHVTELEIEEFYANNFDEMPLRPEMFEIGMILKKIEPSEKTRRATLTEINRIYDRIRSGRDFEDLASEFSDCPSRSIGGDLGFFGKGTMIKEFENAAFALKPGEISEVIETSFGFHIIKMEDRNEEEIRVRHILKMIQPTEADITETVEAMQDVLRLLRKGEDFYELAFLHSDDPTATEGGVIGEFTTDQYPELFKKHLMALNLGDFTELIREEEYIYIFGKLKVVPERAYSLEEIKDDLREYLVTLKQAEHYEKWISDLMLESYVEILLD